MTASATSPLGCEPSEIIADASTDASEQLGLFSRARLEALYRSQAARLVRRLARHIGHDEAGDVVQDAFVKLAGGSAARSGPIVSPEAFATTVATNVLRDRARAAARRALQQNTMVRETVAAPDPHRIFESREALQAIERALADMTPRRRRIFMLHRFEHLTYAEIGAEVGMSEKAIKTQIAKALAALRLAAGDLL